MAQHVDLPLPPERPHTRDDIPPEDREGTHVGGRRRPAAGLRCELHDDHARGRSRPARHELDLLRSVAAGRRHIQPADGSERGIGLQHRQRRDRHRAARRAELERQAHRPLLESVAAARRADAVHGHGGQGPQRRPRRRERASAHRHVHDDRGSVGAHDPTRGRRHERAALRRHHLLRDADGPQVARRQDPRLRIHRRPARERRVYERRLGERQRSLQVDDPLHRDAATGRHRSVWPGPGRLCVLVHHRRAHRLRFARAPGLQLAGALLVHGRADPLLPDDEPADGRVHALAAHRGRRPPSHA